MICYSWCVLLGLTAHDSTVKWVLCFYIEDNVYWDRYKSYKLEAGGSVLAGPGLEWSPSDHPEDAVEPGSHARHLGDACRAALITAAAGDGDGIYRAFWQGRRAPGSRKWFLQDALCGQSGQPCAKRHDEL